MKCDYIVRNQVFEDKSKIVFLDRDGVINDNSHYYVSSVSGIVILPRVRQAIDMLYKYGYSVIIISNQSCIGKGLVSRQEMVQINNFIVSQIDLHHVIKGVFWCPHTEEDRCKCRKPQVGMLVEAINCFGLDSTNSSSFWFIGDSDSDVLCGENFGINSIKISSGQSHYADLYDAVVSLLKTAI